MGLRGGLRASTEKQYFSPHIIERPSTFIFHQFPMYIRDLRSLKTNIKDFYFCVIDCKLTLFINLIFIYITMKIFHSWSRRHVIMFYICQCIRFEGNIPDYLLRGDRKALESYVAEYKRHQLKFGLLSSQYHLFLHGISIFYFEKKDTILEQHC